MQHIIFYIAYASNQKASLFFFYFLFIIIHTYIIGHYNPLVRIIDLISHTTYDVCVNFMYKRRDLFLTNFSWQFLFTLRVFARNLLRENRRRNTFRILLWCLVWGSNPGFSSNKPTHYLLDYGGFNIFVSKWNLPSEIQFE